MWNTLVVVYRESFEAILIVGILYSYLIRHNASKTAFRFMWGGVLAGLVLSAFLAFAISAAQSEFQGQMLEYFNYGILAVAIVLMTHMCIWMKHHARTLKTEIHENLHKSLSHSEFWSIASLACLAVAREGSEAVIFLQGMFIEARETGQFTIFSLMACGGLLAGYATWIAFNKGMKFFKPQVFFRVTTVLLFLTASSLTLSLARKLIQSEIIPAFKDPIWDTSFILDERSNIGQFVTSWTGYQSTPALMTVLIYAAYWGITLFFYTRADRRAQIKGDQHKHTSMPKIEVIVKSES